MRNYASNMVCITGGKPDSHHVKIGNHIIDYCYEHGREQRQDKKSTEEYLKLKEKMEEVDATEIAKIIYMNKKKDKEEIKREKKQ